MKMSLLASGFLIAIGFGSSAMAQIATCQDAVDALRPVGTACNQISDFGKRKSCFDQAPATAKVPQDVMQRCQVAGGPLDALKTQLMTQEHTAYPDQQSGLSSDNGNNGNNNNNGGPNNGSNKGRNGKNGKGNNRGQPNNGGSNNGNNNNGSNNGGNNNGPAAQVTAAQCTDVTNALRPVGQACLNISDFNQRKSCFDQAPGKSGMDPAVVNGCMNGNFLNGLKAELQGTEKSKYPDQASALDGNNNNGGNNNQPGNNNNRGNNGRKGKNGRGGNNGGNNNQGNNNGPAPSNGQYYNSAGGLMNADGTPATAPNNGGNNNQPMNNNNAENNGRKGKNGKGGNNQNMNNGPAAQVTADQCNGVIAALRPVGQACLAISDFNQRKSCFDQAPGKSGMDPAVVNGCMNGNFLNGLKSELQTTEKSKYPDQASALDGNNSNGGNNNNNGGNKGKNKHGSNGDQNNGQPMNGAPTSTATMNGNGQPNNGGQQYNSAGGMVNANGQPMNPPAGGMNNMNGQSGHNGKNKHGNGQNNGMPMNGQPNNGQPMNNMPNGNMPANGMPNNGQPMNGGSANGQPAGN
jgi:hypothetical protein